MADLDIKSIKTMEAGIKLMSNEFYTQSIHCFYYSVLQMMKYKLAHCEGSMSYESQEEKRKQYSSSTHDWLFSEIKPKIENKDARVAFVRTFRKLRDDRVDADYNQRTFDQEESVECRMNADELLAKLRNIKEERR